MRISVNNNEPQFRAKPLPADMPIYRRTISEGLKVLDKKMGFIIHNNSVPAKKAANTGIGSLLSITAATAFIPFLQDHGFTSIQQEPSNLRGGDPSPYSPLTTGQNIYTIPLDRLASPAYDYLLSRRTLQAISTRVNNGNINKINYNDVRIDYDHALWEVFSNYRTQKYNNCMSETVKQLDKEFSEYYQKNKEELEPQAIYEILAKKYNNDNWKNWKKTDRELYDSNPDEKAQKRLDNIKKKRSTEIDFYIFKQFLTERELAKFDKRNLKSNIKIIGDSPIAFSPYEEWRNKDLFMEGLALGCPPDNFSATGQRWGFSVLKPETIFNSDGSLGPGGELMKKRYEKMFANASGGARIDHTIGLIDPFVYSTKENIMTPTNSGRLYSSPNHPILGKYARKTPEEYEAVLAKILIPAAEKFGLTKDDIIFEDLGALTEPVINTIKNLGLSGIEITQYDSRGKYTAPNKVLMPGCHDNISYREYTDTLFDSKEQGHLKYKAGYLAKDTVSFDKKVKDYKKELLEDKKKFIAASFAELFTSPAKRIQIFFSDFFGINETYNRPGTTKDCWTLRLGNDYEKTYYNNLSDGYGINLPEAIASAIRHKGKKFAEKHQDLLQRLDKFTEILKS